MKKTFVIIGIAALAILLFWGRDFISSGYSSSKLIGEWTMYAFEFPPAKNEAEQKGFDILSETLKEACDNKSMKTEFFMDLTFTTFDNDFKTGRTGTFMVENGNLIKTYKIEDRKGQIPDVQEIVKLSDKQLILETSKGFKTYYSKNK
jgi:hypothetical protein